MKIQAMIALAGAGAVLVPCATARGVYTGLTVELHTAVSVGGGPRWVYRVYADFTDENDYLTAVEGSSALGNLVIQSRNATDTGAGNNFFNPGGAGANTAPSSPASPNYWGTYVTIGISSADQVPGVASGGDPIGLSPGFPNFINGNQLSSNNIGWFTAGPDEVGRAGFLGDGDAALRVQIMQLTVNEGENVRGTVAVNGVNAGELGSVFTATGQTFNSIPAPSALGLLAVAGLIGRRSRRRGAAMCRDDRETQEERTSP